MKNAWRRARLLWVALAATAATAVGLGVLAAPAWAPRTCGGCVVGGGWFLANSQRVDFSIVVDCSADKVPAGLGLSYGDPDERVARNRFRLTNLQSANCTIGDPDQFEGAGSGLCNGAPTGIGISISNPDEGPARVSFTLRGREAGPCAVELAGTLGGGKINFIGDPNI